MFAIPGVFVLTCLGIPTLLTTLQNKSLYIQIDAKMPAVQIIMYESYYKLLKHLLVR